MASGSGIERRLTAILSADAVGYSRLMAADEEETLRTITAYREQISSLVGKYRGRVVDAPGDNLLAEFPSALDAVRCALEIQSVVATRNDPRPTEHRMEFRIGVHLGDVMVEGERIYGDGVNIAARLESLAEAGGSVSPRRCMSKCATSSMSAISTWAASRSRTSRIRSASIGSRRPAPGSRHLRGDGSARCSWHRRRCFS